MTTIEILYFDGCPSHEATIDLTRDVASEFSPEPIVQGIRVLDNEHAQRLQFPGSPTVRVDGIDIDADLQPRDEYQLACRVYRNDGVLMGHPPRKWIRDAIERSRRT